MTGTVDFLDARALAERRRSILERIGTAESDLRERGERYALTSAELAVLDELEALDYLRDGLPSRG